MSNQLTTFGDGRDINEDNEEIPEWARPYIRTLKQQVTALMESANEAFIKGVESVTAIRCTRHAGVALLNTNEANGGECAACAVQRIERQTGAIAVRLGLRVIERDDALNALRRIARDYETPAQIHRDSERKYGLPYIEALEMAYENIQAEAAAAIKGKRAPKAGAS